MAHYKSPNPDGDKPIRLMLDISTAHLPEKYGNEQSDESLDTMSGVIVDSLETGFLMWVPEVPEEYALGFLTPVPPEILTVQEYARELCCDYVRFDRDADIVDDLPTWDW